MKLEELGAGGRAVNSLLSNGVENVENLCALREADVLKMDGIGRKTFWRIQEALWSNGLRLSSGYMKHEYLDKIQTYIAQKKEFRKNGLIG